LGVGRIWRRLKRARLLSFERSDSAVESERGVENTDALAASGGRGAMDPSGASHHANFPPNYIKTDDGRPRH
jgi:hypothetical protein